jgi:superfamily II DNA or RNA helicase
MAKAEVLKKLLTQNLANAPIRWGLTGTIPKEDFEYQSLRASLGDVVNHVSAHELQQKGVLSNCHVNIVQTAEWKEFGGYAEELKFLVTDTDRMTFLGNMINTISQSGNTLVLVNRIDSGKLLVELLPDAVFVSGEVKTKVRKEEYDEIKTANNKIIVATYGVAAVGINIPRIFNLVLLEPGKSFVRVIQSIGRGIRKAEDKDHVEIWDITASTKYAKRHLTERKRFYKEAKYPFDVQKVKYQ